MFKIGPMAQSRQRGASSSPRHEMSVLSSFPEAIPASNALMMLLICAGLDLRDMAAMLCKQISSTAHSAWVDRTNQDTALFLTSDISSIKSFKTISTRFSSVTSSV